MHFHRKILMHGIFNYGRSKMREIKFRAWFYKENRMLSWEDLNDGTENLIEYFEKSMSDVSEVMQYSGLHDRNGKEIYEGDIVRGLSYKEPWAMRTKYEVVGRVKFSSKQGFYFCGDLGKGRTYPWLNSCEIIGNIYETPELLNRKEKSGDNA